MQRDMESQHQLGYRKSSDEERSIVIVDKPRWNKSDISLIGLSRTPTDDDKIDWLIDRR